jgi:hypothetical protein
LSIPASHEAKLVTQVQLVWVRETRDEANGVEARGFRIDQILSEQILSTRRRHHRSNWTMVASVGAFQKYAFAI